MPDAASSSHAGAAQLTALAQGKLAEGERAALQAHLAQCPACRQALAAISADSESRSGQETQATSGGAAPPAGARATHRPQADVPADLADHPRYEILQLLGQGGMGAVYKARHRKMDRLVALKVINASLLDNPHAVERFQREVKAAAKLDHPNIVRAFNSDEAGSTHFLVMEFVEGTDLAKHVEKKGPLPTAHACHFIRQAALGLQHAHGHGMVHRDIKPHNLMLAAGGVVKVMDFGLARLARETASHGALTGDNVLMGTADYIAPEQAQDAHRADIRADIYSLGCSLYHLLAGKPPFGGSVVQKIAGHLSGTIALGALPATVPEALRAVLAKMLEKDPARRFQTPAEVAQALAPFIKKAGPAKPAEVPTLKIAADAGSVTTVTPIDEAPFSAPGTRDQEQARRLVRKPAIAVLVAGCLGLAFNLAIVVNHFLDLGSYSRFRSQENERIEKLGGPDKNLKLRDSNNNFARFESTSHLIMTIFLCLAVPSVLAIWGGINMLRMRRHRLAMAGSFSAMVCPLVILIPIGIWSVKVLRKPEVRSAFR